VKRDLSGWVGVGLLALLVVAGLLVSSAEYSDEELAEKHYCAQVRDGAWPDFKGLGSACDRWAPAGKLDPLTGRVRQPEPQAARP
jgi:hypothetical protein